MLETSVTRSSDKPTCILGSNLDVDVEACGMLSDESDSNSLMRLPFASLFFVVVVHAQGWSDKYGSQDDLDFTGPLAFSHLPYHRCLEDESSVFDIAVLGMPFDTAVSYRPGARFGPTGIRIGSRRIHSQWAWSLSWGLSPYEQGFKIIDCGDVCVVPL